MSRTCGQCLAFSLERERRQDQFRETLSGEPLGPTLILNTPVAHSVAVARRHISLSMSESIAANHRNEGRRIPGSFWFVCIGGVVGVAVRVQHYRRSNILP